VRERLLSKARQASPRTSAGRGEPKTPQPGFAGAEALARGNPRSEVPPPEAFEFFEVILVFLLSLLLLSPPPFPASPLP